MSKDIAPVATVFHTSGNEGNVTIERRQDCQPIIDDVARIRQVTNGKSISGDLVHVGRIPAIVIEKYCQLKGISFHDFLVDDTHVTALMNDADYKHLRIWEGRA